MLNINIFIDLYLILVNIRTIRTEWVHQRLIRLSVLLTLHLLLDTFTLILIQNDLFTNIIELIERKIRCRTECGESTSSARHLRSLDRYGIVPFWAFLIITIVCVCVMSCHQMFLTVNENEKRK